MRLLVIETYARLPKYVGLVGSSDKWVSRNLHVLSNRVPVAERRLNKPRIPSGS